MPRKIDIIVPSNMREQVLKTVKSYRPFSLQLHTNSCISPSGDLISLLVANVMVPKVMRGLAELGVGSERRTSITIEEPKAVVSPGRSEEISIDSNEASWEEIDLTLGVESNMSINMTLLMALAGALAAVGLVTNALHLVVGAMVIAPAFEPLIRVGFGLVSRGTSWRLGVRQTITAYGALVAGALVAAVALRASGQSLQSSGSYLPAESLANYWTSFTSATVLVTLSASLAGALVIASSRSVLTAGVMIALALVPGAAMVPVSIVFGMIETGLQAGLRWLFDASVVVIAGYCVFLWKRERVHKRYMFENTNDPLAGKYRQVST